MLQQTRELKLLEMENQKYHRLLIDSKDRLNVGTTDPSNCTINLNQPINRAVQFYVENFQFPRTFYPINSNNNVIYFQDNLGADLTATITPGSYTSSELITAIETAMDAALSGTTSQTVTITEDDNTKKYTFTASADNLAFTFGTNTTNSMRQVIGFDQADVAAANAITAPNVYNLDPIKNIYLRSNFAEGYRTSSGFSDVFLKVSMSGQFGDFLLYTPPQLSYQFGSSSVQSMSFRITDENGNLLDLNGQDWSLSLIIVHHDSPATFQISYN